MQLLASSKSCEVEIFCVGNKTLAVQGHPEIPRAMLEEKVLSFRRFHMDEQELEACLESFTLDLDADLFLKLAVEFMHS